MLMLLLLQLRQAKDEIVTASKVAYRFMAGLASNSRATPESPSYSNRGSPRFQGAWFKNLMSMGAKPSAGTSEIPDETADSPLYRHKSSELPQHNSRQNG
ncbi:hypothetical protein BHE74_00039336 [Ensete ventricosum]|nr:hypothetical protein GW17_00038451 [Ensete ventricosum]RWW54106.1 hypothetical protein BHE74_00039336 [Ensete ventricosum]